MKKQILPFSLVLLGFTTVAGTASAQRYEDRAVQEQTYARGGDDNRRGDDRSERYGRGDRDMRVGAEIEQLNREVRMLREQIRNSGRGRGIWSRYGSVTRATDRVTALYRQGYGRPWELRRRVEQIRSEISEIRRELRFRDIRREIGR